MIWVSKFSVKQANAARKRKMLTVGSFDGALEGLEEGDF